MHVIATAGHVDHGKSTLVRALTGMEPDRWAEERRRGMTIDLGFAWTTLPSAATVAFVDVPGHERFVPNMLAGVGPVPAAMLVVAADEGWKPQSTEHLAALTALDVRHGLLVVTRSDLAGPAAATAEASAELSGTPLADVEAVAVSGTTGAGLDELRAALDRLVARLPAADPAAPVRLWIDRAFSITGAGTVVTGTLGAGRLRVGDELALDAAAGRGGASGRGGAAGLGAGPLVRIRGLQALGEPAGEITAVARVAVNLRGVPRDRITRGAALLTPGRFRTTDLIDVRITGDPATGLPATLTLHAGSASVPVRVRPLGADTCRLRLARPLPLRVGDRALLRDPGRHHVAGGVTVLDVVPPGLSRRGAARARAATLAAMDGRPDPAGELRRRLLVTGADLAAMGVPPAGRPVTGDWYADRAHWEHLAARLAGEVTAYRDQHPLEPGAPVEALRHRLGLPDRALVEALVRPPLTSAAGRISAGPPGIPAELADLVGRAFDGLGEFAAPEAHDLAALGLAERQLAAAVRAGLLFRLAPQVFLRPGTPGRAVPRLAALPQPFTLSEARRALDTTRRVAVPLLELLDREGLTSRDADDRRTVG
ncbi:selenocysteine-specific translation elongation factor [Paractinoplanes rishiriensis]|uniref:Selenocysteine-specific translation elongation factor n=1 Tax=Paractinoplanes rishiriensis TaxID=1050105 RepID=A0A919JTL0_9ACTN|nr:selenocysteine-specific translation elongation factor [Actinoplanes rishiriensis]GIE94543.1 selenocysteine-specific translation elongation factor [Actinoplanes rishiriensis]